MLFSGIRSGWTACGSGGRGLGLDIDQHVLFGRAQDFAPNDLRGTGNGRGGLVPTRGQTAPPLHGQFEQLQFRQWRRIIVILVVVIVLVIFFVFLVIFLVIVLGIVFLIVVHVLVRDMVAVVLIVLKQEDFFVAARGLVIILVRVVVLFFVLVPLWKVVFSKG